MTKQRTNYQRYHREMFAPSGAESPWATPTGTLLPPAENLNLISHHEDALRNRRWDLARRDRDATGFRGRAAP